MRNSCARNVRDSQRRCGTTRAIRLVRTNPKPRNRHLVEARQLESARRCARALGSDWRRRLLRRRRNPSPSDCSPKFGILLHRKHRLHRLGKPVLELKRDVPKLPAVAPGHLSISDSSERPKNCDSRQCVPFNRSVFTFGRLVSLNAAACLCRCVWLWHELARQVLVNAVIGNLKYWDWTCPVIRLIGTYPRDPSTVADQLPSDEAILGLVVL